ncbi:hypothetical protein ACRDNQ_12320 [Palleronia sp. KMU-117]|uniref:hypothetical protein n=1 Tax=Palleronia sp. KMU-117 TaxID=3434108 RepID=UPI003D733813
MDHGELTALTSGGRAALARGPVALIFAEDGAELGRTVTHHLGLGFCSLVLFVPPGLAIPDEAARPEVTTVRYPTMAEGAVPAAVNAVIDAAPPGTWLYWGYNAEFLFYPFCDSRSVAEMLAFHAEERRDAMVAFVIDLYAPNLAAAPDGVSVAEAHLDRTGYHALDRKDPGNSWKAKERQFDFHGGLRWRFEEHVPHERRRIDRVALFRARRGLRLRPDATLTDEEMNTYACPWHNNLTAAVCSFRAARALRAIPGSREAIGSFVWPNSVRFEWDPQQLLDLGLMEAGQWF